MGYRHSYLHRAALTEILARATGGPHATDV